MASLPRKQTSEENLSDRVIKHVVCLPQFHHIHTLRRIEFCTVLKKSLLRDRKLTAPNRTKSHVDSLYRNVMSPPFLAKHVNLSYCSQVQSTIGSSIELPGRLACFAFLSLSFFFRSSRAICSCTMASWCIKIFLFDSKSRRSSELEMWSS